MDESAIDHHVGRRVRMRRKLLGLTQRDLGTALGITCQQVQKYEHGMNRVSASKLYGMAMILGVDPGWFFDGLPGPKVSQAIEPDASHANAGALILAPGGEIIAESFPQIRATQVQREIANLVRELAAVA
jgi:transcriptional regulator with XRE-family HTH domain